MRLDKEGFTLIELLIVVAIIAILAAIALPNFLEAQTRAKISRVKSDQRTMMVAMEMYRVDHQNLPPSIPQAIIEEFAPLTTPIAYITTIPFDQFIARSTSGAYQPDNVYDYCRYRLSIDPPVLYTNSHWARQPGAYHAIVSVGPDHRAEHWYLNRNVVGFTFSKFTYDPTNGTISDGDIFAFSSESRRN